MTSLKKRSIAAPHLSITLELTNRCNGVCSECYQRIAGPRKPPVDLPLETLRESIIPYLKTKFKGNEKPSITVLGGEARLHPQFQAMVDSILECRPHSLDIFTNGKLFALDDPPVWRALNNASAEACVVLSYDEHHRAGIRHADLWLDVAVAKMRKLWDNGSKIGFVISSTRFGDKAEEDVERNIHRACSKHGAAIETDGLDWPGVFRWAKDSLVRIAVPHLKKYFELANREASSSPMPRIDFVLRTDGVDLPLELVKCQIQSAVEQHFASREYSFSIKLSGPVQGALLQKWESRQYENCVQVELLEGTRLNKIERLRSYTPDQVYITSRGFVYTNPIAVGRVKNPYNVNDMPLAKIVKELYQA